MLPHIWNHTMRIHPLVVASLIIGGCSADEPTVEVVQRYYTPPTASCEARETPRWKPKSFRGDYESRWPAACLARRPGIPNARHAHLESRARRLRCAEEALHHGLACPARGRLGGRQCELVSDSEAPSRLPSIHVGDARSKQPEGSQPELFSAHPQPCAASACNSSPSAATTLRIVSKLGLRSPENAL